MPKEKRRKRSSRSSHRRQTQCRSRTARAEPSLVENQEERLLQDGYYGQSLNPMGLFLLVVLIQHLGDHFVDRAGSQAQNDGQSHVAPEWVNLASADDYSFTIFYWYIPFFQVVFYQG